MLKKLGVSQWQLPFVHRALKKESARHMDTVKPFPGIEQVLRTLSKTYHLGLVTSNSQANVRTFLKRYNLEDAISFIITDVGAFAKPKALTHIIRNASIPTKHIMYIGDEIRDGQAAQQVGIPFGAVTYGFNSEKALKQVKADAVFSSPDDIIKIIEGTHYD